MQFFCCIMHEKKLLKLHQIWIEPQTQAAAQQTMKKKSEKLFGSLELEKFKFYRGNFCLKILKNIFQIM